MKIIFILVALIEAFCDKSYCQTRQAIQDVTIVDVTGKQSLQPRKTVIIENGIIKEIADADELTISGDSEIIDGRGKFLIPGLWDMHVHLSYYGAEALDLLIAYGVTGVRDMGGDIKQLDVWRKEIKAHKRTGPMIFRAGPFLDGQKKMDAKRISFTRVVLSAEDGRVAVNELQKLQVDFIKIHSRVPREAFFEIAKEAAKNHIPLVVHAPVNVSVAEISDAGARSIEHTESFLGEAIYEKDAAKRDSLTNVTLRKLEGREGDLIISKIRKNGTWYNPTLVSLYKLKGTEYEKKLGPRLLPIVTKLYKAQIPLLTGSDFATRDAGIIPGRDLHDEMVLFVQAGMTPLETLQSATINAARCLQIQESVGTVEEGKLANVVLLDANPLQDISNTRKINAVFINGKVFIGASLTQLGSH